MTRCDCYRTAANGHCHACYASDDHGALLRRVTHNEREHLLCENCGDDELEVGK